MLQLNNKPVTLEDLQAIIDRIRHIEHQQDRYRLLRTKAEYQSPKLDGMPTTPWDYTESILDTIADLSSYIDEKVAEVTELTEQLEDQIWDYVEAGTITRDEAEAFVYRFCRGHSCDAVATLMYYSPRKVNYLVSDCLRKLAIKSGLKRKSA